MNALAKLGIGPLHTKACRSCGQHVGVPWLPYVLVALAASLLPILVVISAISLGVVGSVAVALLWVLLSAAPALWLHYRCVPLVARGRAGRGGPSG
jgi:hypothetical protein